MKFLPQDVGSFSDYWGPSVHLKSVYKLPQKQLFLRDTKLDQLKTHNFQRLSIVPWKLWGISFQMRYWEAHSRQYYSIGGHLKFVY